MVSLTGNRKLDRAGKSNHVEDKSWYYAESISWRGNEVSFPPTLENFNLLEVTDISVFLSSHCCNRFVSFYGIQFPDKTA